MNIKLTTTIRRSKPVPGKAFIDVICKAQSEDLSDSQTDPNIFVIQNLPKNALGECPCTFSHVADPVDLQDYPSYRVPDMPYFRTNQVTLRVRSQYQADRIVNIMRKELNQLMAALKLLPESEETFSQSFSS